MKTNYIFNGFTRWLKPAMVTAMAIFCLNGNAEDINWTGAVDSDASNPANWNPALTIIDNNLMIDSASKYTNTPILNLTGENQINTYNMKATGVLTIENAGEHLNVNTGSNTYSNGKVILNNGFMTFRKSYYMTDSTTEIIINGGTFETRSYFLISKYDNTPEGGYIEISGNGQLHCSVAPIRFPTNIHEGNGIKMTDSAIMLVKGDWVAGAEGYIASGQLYSDNDNDPYAYYDADIAKTYVALRSKDELFLKNTATVQVLENDVLDTIFAAENRAFETLTNKEWKFASVSGGPYQSFSPAQTEGSLNDASFSSPGVYYVILEANDGTIFKSSEEVMVSVSSRMVAIDPIVVQTLRIGQVGGMITATEKETATSREWKWSETSGGPYESFPDQVTATEYTPDFDSLGIYYVVCESLVGGVSYTSPEATIKVVETSFPLQNLYWTGIYSNDAADCRNYDPMMLPYSNKVIVGKEFASNPPVLTTPGTESISDIYCEDSAEFIVRKAATDTLFVRSKNIWQNGKIVVESGVTIMNDGYGRLDSDNAGIVVKNNGRFIHDFSGGFIIGKGGSPNGGSVTIQDDAYMYVHHFWRFATDTTNSVITISENGLLEMAGDMTAEVASWKALNQIRAKEGFTIKYSYDPTTEMTKVVAKSDIAFNLASSEAINVGVGVAGDEITTINDEAITSREWKYSTTSGEAYISFSPAETSATISPLLADTGVYYVICEGTDGTETIVTDEVAITSIGVAITPAADQTIEPYETFATLAYAANRTADRKEWKKTMTSGSDYVSFPIAQKGETCSALMTTEGVYYIVLEAMYGDVAVLSNEVKVTVQDPSAAIKNTEAQMFSVYPNPTEGKFNITTQDAGQISVKVYDITGKCVLSNSNLDRNQELEINNAGLYYIEVMQNGQTEVSKLLVK